MHISVNLEPAIINQCLNLHYGNHPLGRRQLKKLVWIPLILLALSVYLIYPSIQQRHALQNLYPGLLYLGFAAGYYFFMRKRMLTSGKSMASSLQANARFTMIINEEHLTTITAAETFNTHWPQFTEALVSAGIVLLYQQNGSFSMYHQTFFQTGDFDLFKQWVVEKVRPVLQV